MDPRSSRYHEVYARWQRDTEGFWGEAAQEIDWIVPAKRVFDPNAGLYGRWFGGGVCNTCWNAVDRDVMQGHGERTAIIYDSPLAEQKRTFTYHALSGFVALMSLRHWLVGARISGIFPNCSIARVKDHSGT